MQMQHVRYFLALCDERNFTRAALRCGVKQPTLTRSIKDLEAELGGALFERQGRNSTLTALGAAVRPHMTAIAVARERAQRTAAAFVAGHALPLPSTIVVPGHPEENAMRKAIFLAAIAVVVLLASGALRLLLHPATAAQRAAADKPSNVYAIEKTIDVQHLPRIAPLAEADH
jgi:Bacterial regulatory helix-turn-helix protein, lysR family